jgi:endonuclease/exonuclease/phosphatase family metal-dependent hydrolase
VRLASWNLWGVNVPVTYFRRGKRRGAMPGSPASDAADPGAVWARRRRLIAAELATLDPDCIALQECARQPGGRSTGAAVAPPERYVTEGDALDRNVGLALVSRYPPRRQGMVPIRSELFGYPEPLWVEVELDGVLVRVVSVHLPLAKVGPRRPVVEELARFSERCVEPVIVAGDLNMEPDDEILDVLGAAGFSDLTARCDPSMPNPDPVVRLDYILLRGSGTVRAAHTIGARPDDDGFLPSDHRGVLVEVELER